MKKIKNLNKLVIDTYDVIADRYNQEFGDDMSDKEYVDKFLEFVEKGKILDVGCGVGNLTKYINDNGFDVIGIDLSQGMLNIAKERFKDIDFKIMDMTNIELPKNSFDALFVAYSLFYLPSDKIEGTISGFVELLKEKGKIMFILQEGEGDIIIDEPFYPNKKLYINYFTKEEISNLLESFGFKILYLDTRCPKSDIELKNNKIIIIAELK